MADFVLVHGTTQSASGYRRLQHALGKRGHRALAPQLPTNRPQWLPQHYAEAIASDLPSDLARPVVAAHSASGLLLPAMARTLGASAMVWLAAYVPHPAVSLREELADDPEKIFNPEWLGQDPTTDPVAAAYFLFHDCDYSTLRWALGTLRLFHPQAAYEHRLPDEAIPSIPSRYVVATEDRTIRPSWSKQVGRSPCAGRSDRADQRPLPTRVGARPTRGCTRPLKLTTRSCWSSRCHRHGVRKLKLRQDGPFPTSRRVARPPPRRLARLSSSSI